MLRLGTQIAIDDKECENVSPDGDPNCKKRRTREVTFPIPKMPATTNSSMSGNFKTHLCSNFRMGHCSYGNRCVFAHGIGEMRKRLPNMPGTWNGDYKMAEQSKFCRMFYFRKECSYGDNCRFLHANPDNSKQGMGYFRENSSITIGSRGFSGMQRSGYGISKPVIKTRLCNKWEMTGSCHYGNICRFAHGQAELKKPEGHIALVSGFMPIDTTTTLPTGKVGIWTTRGHQVQGKKYVFKSKTVEKLAGIYADWIEGTSFFA